MGGVEGKGEMGGGAFIMDLYWNYRELTLTQLTLTIFIFVAFFFTALIQANKGTNK